VKPRRKQIMRRRAQHGRVYQYNPFAGFTYESLPPEARDKLQLLIDNDLFWEYAEQLRVLKEKAAAVTSYMDAIIKRVQKGKQK
jgi:hypothetical protein